MEDGADSKEKNPLAAAKYLQDKLLGLHALVKDFEGTTNELSIDVKNFQDEIECLDSEKKVDVPG